MKIKWTQNHHIYKISCVIDKCIIFKSSQSTKIYVLKALSTMRRDMNVVRNDLGAIACGVALHVVSDYVTVSNTQSKLVPKVKWTCHHRTAIKFSNLFSEGKIYYHIANPCFNSGKTTITSFDCA